MIMDIKNLLISKAKEIGVKVSPAQAEQFQIYLDLLLERNTVMNLTAITEPDAVAQLHLLAALAFLFFTSFPPSLPLFVDPTNGTRGIPPKTL